MKAIILDTETTGLLLPSTAPLEKQPRIVELGLVVVENGKLISEHNWLINPERPIPADATKVSGITDEMVADKPKFRELLAEIEEIFGGTEMLICHNAPFDTGMLKNELLMCSRTGFPWPAEIICTVQEFLPVFGKRPKLTKLYEHFMDVPLAQTHRANDDARAVFEILDKVKFFDQLGYGEKTKKG